MKPNTSANLRDAFGGLLVALFSFLCLATTARAADGSFALSFVGVDDYVAVANSSGGFNSFIFTATACIKTSQTVGEQGIINKYVAGSLNGWQMFLFSGELRAWFFGGDGSTNWIWDGGRGLNAGSVANGQWRHIAFAVDGTGGRLYVDGTLRASRV